MKKTKIYLLPLLFLVYSCNNETTNTTSQSGIDSSAVSIDYVVKHPDVLYDIREMTTSKQAGAATATGIPVIINTQYKFKDSFDHFLAIDSINNYNASSLTDRNNLFTMGIDTLESFVTATTSGNADYFIQFLLAYNNPARLNLIICAANDLGDNIYVQETGGNANVIKLVAKPPLNNTPFQLPMGVPVHRMPRYANGATFNSADSMVRTYRNKLVSPNTATSFTVDADDFSDYLSKLKASNATKVHIYLGEDNNKLVLIIAGYNIQNKYIYLRNGAQNSCVYEHCNPCPTCSPLYMDGRTIEQ
jgi:hypothetical protein